MNTNVLKNLKNKIIELQEEIDKLLLEDNLSLEQKEKYCLNVFVDKPKFSQHYYLIHLNGDVVSFIWDGNDFNVDYFENTILFKDRQSAETYKELRQDMKKLSKEFECGKCNYTIEFDVYDHVVTISEWTRRSFNTYYFTDENAQLILDKYGQEVLKNYILYCK